MNTILYILHNYQFFCTAELDFDCITFHRYISYYFFSYNIIHHVFVYLVPSFISSFLFSFVFFFSLSFRACFVVPATQQIEWMIRSNHPTGVAIYRP